jgi:hypothetical protein
MKYFIPFFLLICCLSANSQDSYKNVDVKSDYTLLSYKLFAKSPLTKENTYQEAFPPKLQYSPSASIETLINPFLSLDAKKAKAGQPSTVTFKYVTEGVTVINDDGAYSTIAPNFIPQVKWYYKRLSYSCPFKVEIYNEQNQLVKTLVIANANKLFYLSMDKNFLAPPAAAGQTIAPLPFTSNEEANNFYNTNKQKIAEKIEAMCLASLRDDIRKAIYSVYDFSKYQKTMIWFFQVEKKSQPAYPDLFEKTEQFKDLLKDFDDPVKKEAAVKGLQGQYDLYTQKLQAGQQLPEDIKQLCRYNGAVAAMFINKMEDSKKLYTDFYNKFYLKVPFGITILPDNFLTLYKYHYIYNQIQDNLTAASIDISQGIEEVHYSRFLNDNKLVDTRMLEAKKAANPENAGYDEKRNKEIIKATWLSYICWNTGSNTEHIQPDAFVFKDGTKEISGQKFLSASGPKKYYTIALGTTTGNVQKALFTTNSGNFNVAYTWEFNKLTGIKIDGLSDYEYDFIYDETQTIIGIKAKKLINDEIQVIVKAQLDGDKIIKTTKWENHKYSKDEWARAIKDISYTDTGIVVFCRTYFTGKANTEKNSSTLTGVYKKPSGRSYIISQPWGVSTENSYNDNDDILRSVETKKNGIDEHDFFYNDKQLYKEVIVEKELTGIIKMKVVNILDVPANLPANAPGYEKQKGQYKFSPEGEMIFESNGTQYRTKTNGAWSEWKYFRY